MIFAPFLHDTFTDSKQLLFDISKALYEYGKSSGRIFIVCEAINKTCPSLEEISLGGSNEFERLMACVRCYRNTARSQIF